MESVFLDRRHASAQKQGGGEVGTGNGEKMVFTKRKGPKGDPTNPSTYKDSTRSDQEAGNGGKDDGGGGLQDGLLPKSYERGVQVTKLGRGTNLDSFWGGGGGDTTTNAWERTLPGERRAGFGGTPGQKKRGKRGQLIWL